MSMQIERAITNEKKCCFYHLNNLFKKKNYKFKFTIFKKKKKFKFIWFILFSVLFSEKLNKLYGLFFIIQKIFFRTFCE